MTGLDPAEFLSLVEAAALAPSADNRREVQLEHAGRRVRLWGDQTWRSAPEHRRIMSLVAIGAAVENVKLRAGRLGFETKVCWFPDSGNPGLVAEIDVDRLPQTRVDPIEVAIERRRTNRRVRFRGPPLSQGELGALSAEATGIDGIQLHWFDSPETRKQILRLVRLAETERFRSRELHEELFSAVRFDIGWTASSDDGLPPGSLEVEAWMRPMFRGLRHWRVLRLLRTVGMHHALGLRAGLPAVPIGTPCGRADDVSRPRVGCADCRRGFRAHLVADDTIGRGTAALCGFRGAFPAGLRMGCTACSSGTGGGLEPVSARPLANDGLPDWPCAGAVSSHNASIG